MYMLVWSENLSSINCIQATTPNDDSELASVVRVVYHSLHFSHKRPINLSLPSQFNNIWHNLIITLWNYKSCETLMRKIISDHQIDESPSLEYQLYYVTESEYNSNQNCSLFPEVFNITSQTIIKGKYKELSALPPSLSKKIHCRNPNCHLRLYLKKWSTWNRFKG